MKKVVLKIIPMILFIIGCAGGAKPIENSIGQTGNTGDMTLDQALKEDAFRIDERIAAGSKIAPLNFNSSHDKFSSYVLDELTANLVDSRKLAVVDRKEVNLIRSEFDFQFSGEVGDDSMQELGRMLGAQSIISGSLTDLGGFYRIVIRVLNVQNASVEVQYRTNIINDTIVAALLTGGKSGGMASPQRVSSGSSSQSALTVQSPVGSGSSNDGNYGSVAF
jgi:TolB-like protein